MESYIMWSLATGFFNQSLMFARFIHILAWVSTSFLFEATYFHSGLFKMRLCPVYVLFRLVHTP